MHNLDVVRNPRVRTSFTYNLSYERFLQAHYNEAFRVSELTREQATKYQLSWALAHADWVLAAASLGVRDFVQADRCLRRVERAGNDLEDPFVALNAAALRARLHLVLQRIDEAEEALSVIDHRAVNPAMKAEVKALRALVFALRGDVKSAIAEAEEANAMTTAIEVHAYVACAHAVIPATNECATKPLRMARQFNVWDPLVTTVRAHPPLLKRLACDGRSHAQLQSVLRRSNDFDLARWAGIPLGKRPKRERTLLSPREREVIELVSQGFTDKRIAEALFISRGTAKVHVRHILDKFGARSRAEAVARYTLGSE
jgi:ATP/maltotriose-dependent transcriptional regulator MalT